MDKAREEFEKEFAGENFEYQGMGGYYTDPIVQAKFEGFEKGYTKETEPLKWRWDRSILYVGSYVVATIEPERDEDGITGWFAKSDAEEEELAWAVPEPEAKKACEDWAESFLAKLRGEA